MTWIRAHYDRAAALAAALFLLCSALIIVRNVSNVSESFSALQTAPPRKPAVPPPKTIELEQATEKLRKPAQWTTSGRSGLFVPEKHFIGANGLPTTLQTTEVHPPVPNEWLEQFALPIAEADVLNQDPDADGFNNLEEWQSHTNPTNKASHPPFIVKLKLKSFAQAPFRLVFASWVDDTYAINTSDLKAPTQFLKLGDSIRGTKFKLEKFAEKFELNQYGTRIDASELTLVNQETHEQLTLVKEKIMTSPESVANFVYAWREFREFAVRKDQEFSLKPEEQIKYKLVDVQPAKAVVVNTQTPNDLIEVGLLNP
ncbi:MAG TPA: Amuc_1099 family pilus-like system protein [Chthoniobacterales bacterium]|nr:Amuc_1099 family pilus-like system protein [Chthoniobacterales bacterium]